MENKEILGLLGELKDNSETFLMENVITIILDECEDEPLTYIKDVLKHGCVSGCVGALVYYSQTSEFFKNNCEEIFELLEEYKDVIGEYPKTIIDDINSNTLAWFGFEYTLYNLANQLEIEY